MTDKTEEKKYHRVGWWRSLYYYMGWTYESDNDKPLEKDVIKKQVLCKQINLSKLKMKKVIIEPNIPFDLQKIDTNDKKIPLPLCDDLKPPKLTRQTAGNYIKTPSNSPKLSQKQTQQRYGTRYSNKNNLP